MEGIPGRFVQPIEGRHLAHARGTPGGPEVEDDAATLEIGKGAPGFTALKKRYRRDRDRWRCGLESGQNVGAADTGTGLRT